MTESKNELLRRANLRKAALDYAEGERAASMKRQFEAYSEGHESYEPTAWENLEQTDYYPLNIIIVAGSLVGVVWFAITKLWSLLA